MKDSYGKTLFFIQFIVFTSNIVNEVVARVVTCDLSIGHDNSEVQQQQNISKNKVFYKCKQTFRIYEAERSLPPLIMRNMENTMGKSCGPFSTIIICNIKSHVPNLRKWSLPMGGLRQFCSMSVRNAVNACGTSPS